MTEAELVQALISLSLVRAALEEQRPGLARGSRAPARPVLPVSGGASPAPLRCRLGVRLATASADAADLEGALSKRMVISPVPCDVVGLCDMLHVSRSTLYRIRARALDHLQRLRARALDHLQRLRDGPEE